MSSWRRRLNGVVVGENRNRMKNELERLGFAGGELFIAENYPEAVGIMTALGKGAALSSVRRPLAETKVSCERVRGSVEAEADKG